MKTLESSDRFSGDRGLFPSFAPGPRYLSSLEEVNDAVDIILRERVFAFDVETLGVLQHHPDLEELVDQQVRSHALGLKTTSESVIERSRVAKERSMTKSIALDPHRNEVIWLGLATYGHSWAIPVGHPKGQIVEPEESGDGTTVPPEGYRKVLKNGTESLAKARYLKPAVYSKPPQQLSRTEVFAALRPIFFDPDIVKVGHNVKFDSRTIAKYYGELPVGPFHDTMLLQHVLDENISSFRLTSLISKHFPEHDPYARHGKVGAVIGQTPFSVACDYVHLDARWTWLLYQRLMRSVRLVPKMLSVFEQDAEVLGVLMAMEHEGMSVHRDGMAALGVELDDRMQEVLSEITALTYPGFNPDSVKDKRLFLFSKKADGGLGLKPNKQTDKGQASVDQEALKAMGDKHPVVPLFLAWSECKKMKSTYIDGLLEKINNERLHPNFHLHRTATGRLSSSEPNLQNIPRDSSIRGLFQADPGCTLIVADYDQIELRVMAMFSRDPNMLDIFHKGIDIHAGAAALVFDKNVNAVTHEERQLGKAANFLTAYGGGSGKLAATAGITQTRAKFVINQYYEQFSGLNKWKRKIAAQAQRDGYVTTISGRRRRLLDINSDKEDLRARAERQAVNAVIQGSASDICKKAMIKSHPVVLQFGGKLIVQVHDELVVNVPDTDEVDLKAEALRSAMGHGKTIKDVPLIVSSHSGRTWAEAKG
jgi:DNA polymerase-1